MFSLLSVGGPYLSLYVTMPFDVHEFKDNPSLELLTANPPRKDDWIFLAKHYGLKVKSGATKSEIRASVIDSLVLSKQLPDTSL